MPQAQAMNPILTLVPFVLIFIIFQFLIFRPQKKKEQEHLKMLERLTKNDEIVTSGGIHGTVVNVKDKTVVIRIDENVKMEIEKSCIAYIKKEGA